jgi:glycosyltransferase involved in cell wall biosynthesis
MRRLSQVLKKKGHQSQILVGRSKYPEELDIHLIWDEVRQFRSLPNSLKSRIGNQIEKHIGIHSWANRPNLNITDAELYKWADIIELRNLFGGYFNLWSLPSLTAGKPVVWRLPDLWAVTGHCAFPYDCDRWKTGCYECPLLTPEGRKHVEPPPTVLDGTRRVWREKRGLYKQSSLHIVVNSKWMRDQVSRSILGKALSINVISNGVELDIYQPRDKKQARSILGLPADEKIMLYVAHRLGAYRKGFHLASQAMEIIQEKDSQPPMFITMGSQERWVKPERLKKFRHFEYVKDPEKQALIYAAADAFLCTTLAEGQPQTALESMASGTPVIAFDIGPMAEEVIDGKTGFVVPSQDVEALVDGIERFLNNEDLHPVMGENCRKQALEKYDLDKQTEKYIRLYEGILDDFRIKSSLK